jgi:phage terminase large subunit-like protein
VLAFEPTQNDPHWRLLAYFWLPGVGLLQKGERDGVDYLNWVKEGWLETTPGEAIDKSFIVARLGELSGLFDIVEIAYDRWRIKDLRVMAENEGLAVLFADFGQGFKDMSPAVDALETALINRNIKHNGNPALTWCAANTVMVEDAAGNRKPAKNKSTGRIDGIVAAIMACSRGMLAGEKEIKSEIIFL